jgi:hypothetical protein
LLVQINAKECVVPIDENDKDFELKKMKKILQKYDIVTTERKKSIPLLR